MSSRTWNLFPPSITLQQSAVTTYVVVAGLSATGKEQGGPLMQ